MIKKEEWIALGIAEALEEKQQKLIIREDKCGYSVHYNDPQIFCVDSAEEAEKKAGNTGWWCCNCSVLDNIC